MIQLTGYAPIREGDCRVVAEAGNCNGSLNWARTAVRQAADSGAWGFKVQLYDPHVLATPDAPVYGNHDYIKESDTQQAHFGNQLGLDDWLRVQDICEANGLVFFASVFSEKQVALGEALDIPLYKIASADITDRGLIEAVALTGKPIILSTGAATILEIQRAFQWIERVNQKVPVLPLICTLSYPTPLNEANLRRIQTWQTLVGPFVGYSDHTQGLAAMYGARELGAVMIEKHFTWTPGKGGDHDFAATPNELAAFHEFDPPTRWELPDVMLGSGALEPIAAERPAMRYARKYLTTRFDIPQGDAIQSTDLLARRVADPDGAFEPWEAFEKHGPVGQLAGRDIAAGETLKRKDVGGVLATLTVE